jgi:hypothetical protein
MFNSIIADIGQAVETLQEIAFLNAKRQDTFQPGTLEWLECDRIDALVFFALQRLGEH